LQNPDVTPTQPIAVKPAASTPNGAKGRIVLAKPELTGQFLADGTYTGNIAEDLLYETWLYAVVVTTDGHLDGLYLTKDEGQNWTKVRVPTLGPPKGNQFIAAPTNDPTPGDFDVLGYRAAQGNYDVSLGIDPTNPSVVYVGGTADFQGAGFLRVDTTAL